VSDTWIGSTGGWRDCRSAAQGESGEGLCTAGVTLPLALTQLGLIDEDEFVVQQRLAGHGADVVRGLSKVVDLRLLSRLDLGSGVVAMRYAPRT
jgi:hypothetical protein